MRIKRRLKNILARRVTLLAIAFVAIAVPLILPKGGQIQPQVVLPQAETLPKLHPEPAKESPVAEQTFEERNKDEDLIFLLHEIVIEVNEDWSYTKKTHKRIKILKESAKDMGEIPVSYEKGREKLTDISACTITPDGEKHPYSRIQDFNTYEGYRMYSDYRYKIITLPEVNIGSILEYETTKISKGRPIKDTFWYYSTLDSTIPIKEHRLTITFPKSLNIKYKGFNIEYEPKITEEQATVTYSWHIIEQAKHERNTESFSPPLGMESITNYIEFSSIDNWAGISGWYYSLIQKNLKINSRIKKATEEAIEGQSGIRDKTRGIFEYIQENFRYVSMSFGDNALEPHPTNKVFRNKYGDCKDLSLLCMAMLKRAGIKSYMTMFNTELDITDPQQDLPIPSFFNHILLLVEDPEKGDFYADPLLDGFDIGQYPMAYQRAYTFVITGNGGRFKRFPVFDEERNHTYTKKTVAMNPDGSAIIETEHLWGLYLSIRTRKLLNRLNEEKKEEFFKGLDDKYEEAFECRWENLEQKYGRIKSYIKFKQKDEFIITHDIITIDIPGADRINDFEPEKRTQPIFYPENSLKETVTTYRIPEGFRISHVPQDINLDIGLLSAKRHYIQKENEITVSETRKTRRIELPAEDCKKVKDFFDQLPKKTNQRIVLKKIKPCWQEIKDIIKIKR